ncbi:hypothetical protein [Candidatus Endomicrobiellum agilis]
MMDYISADIPALPSTDPFDIFLVYGEKASIGVLGNILGKLCD